MALGVSIALMVAVGALTLTRAPPRVVRGSTKTHTALVVATEDMEVCQANELLPSDVSAVRLSLGAFYGSGVRVKAFSDSRILAEGRRGPDWTGRSVTVPIPPLKQAAHVKLCIDIGPNSEPISVAGFPTSAQATAVSSGGEPLGGRVGVEYLAAGRGSWWSRILSVARHIGIGHVLSGTWVALLIAALMAAVGFLTIRLALRELP